MWSSKHDKLQSQKHLGNSLSLTALVSFCYFFYFFFFFKPDTPVSVSGRMKGRSILKER